MLNKFKRLTGVILTTWAAFALVVVPLPRVQPPLGTLPAFAQFSGGVPLDTQLCPTVGAIAVRNANRWQCVTPGTSGQVFKSNGAGTVPGWTTPAGTGNVNASGTPTANQIAVWTDAVTVKGLSGGGALFDLVNGFSGTGYTKRTGAAAYTQVATIPVADGGTACASASFTCLDNITGASGTGILERTGAGAYTFLADPLPLGNGGTGQTTAGGAADAILGLSANGFVRRTGAGTYTISVTPLGVNLGGTGSNAASGTALDNITGFSGIGLLQRTGAGAYSFGTFTSYLDALSACSTQGSVLYRNASAWVCLGPGSAGQVLSSNGAGANPSWVAAGSVTPGTRVLLSTLTFAGDASKQDTTSINASYGEYELDCMNVSNSTTTADLYLRVALSSAPSTFLTTGYNANSYLYNSSGASGNAQTTYIGIAPAGVGLVNTLVRFSNPTGTGKTAFSYSGGGASGANGTGVSNQFFGAGYYATAGAISGYQVGASAGTVTNGACKLYGWN